ncbi:hypothetical protein [Pseudonocardia asaccharolytica]|uniref:Uncharacterized protein n=1 Tax=Pseudonocardia asaccharolytica DSM 44247 = NBRC 16224 TaxID=1123024 RepID=A0A511CWQ3_9PSEU|nr:hypothetical protein [Pseudonocardia asaccharolytica]GEL16907.1 hypothetical protein PA7_07440 [Pseudonocardia asaccharolytica DSM 44247 = NBRC 16224]
MKPPEPRPGNRPPSFRFRLLRAVLRTVLVYGLLVWGYLAANSRTHPETLQQPLTHFLSWPIEEDAAIGCFIASAAAFFVLRTPAVRDRGRH